MAYSPQAITAAWSTIKQAIPSARLGGIYARKPGYHNSRNGVGAGDYSRQRSDDRNGGDPNGASALDITLSDAQMKICTQRLITAVRNKDPRVRAVREFFGTVNGRTVTGLDAQGYWVTSDASHLWHIHVSGYRRWNNSHAEWQKIASVITGQGSAPPPPKPPTTGGGKKTYGPMHGVAVPRMIAQGTGKYFGSISGPAKSLGGINDMEKRWVKLLQQQLIFLGFVPGQSNPNSSWADGIFDTRKDKPGQGATSQAVARFQRRFMPGTQFYGQVWFDDWRKLASLAKEDVK